MTTSTTKRLKILTVVGTRPEIIRLSRVIARLDQVADHCLVHTGQNYDSNLKDVFFRDLELRPPDHYWGIDNSSLGTALGDIMRKTEAVLLLERPDALLVLGDTNSALSAIVARRMHVPIYHMEAGNRAFDLNVPEETNRRIVDAIADFNLAYTEHARRHLLAEGHAHRRVHVTGSPLREVIDHYANRIAASSALHEHNVKSRGYFVVSLHREENVDRRDNLRALIEILDRLAEVHQLPLLVSFHPRTRARFAQFEMAPASSLVRLLEPMGFFDWAHLQSQAFCVISDSGSVSEEAAILGFPAVIVRNSTERPEAIETGACMIAGLQIDRVLDAVALLTSTTPGASEVPVDYTIRNTSERVVRMILGTARLSRRWHGIDTASFERPH